MNRLDDAYMKVIKPLQTLKENIGFEIQPQRFFPLEEIELVSKCFSITQPQGFGREQEAPISLRWYYFNAKSKVVSFGLCSRSFEVETKSRKYN